MWSRGKTFLPSLARALSPLAFVALTARCGGSGDEPGGGSAGDGNEPTGASASGGAAGAMNQAGRNPFERGASGSAGSGVGASAGNGGEAGAGGSGASGESGSSGSAGVGGAAGGQTGVDADKDGIDDGLEDTLARRFAPILRLTKGEQYLPGSVAWYLPRVHMRFDHSGCPDHEIIALGKANVGNLSQQKHQNAAPVGLPPCGHDGPSLLSSASHLEFFLQPPDDAVHDGAPQVDWRAYAHVKPSGAGGGGVEGGYDVQYWFFYPFNSTTANFDHEGDWEHVTVVADAAGGLVRARYAAHSGGTTHAASALELDDATSRPVGYVALGSHATYNKPGEYPTEVPGFIFTDRADGQGPTFDTAVGLVNVGERGAPLNGQTWIEYGGRWGEIGQLSDTSGPPTPSFQGTWNGL